MLSLHIVCSMAACRMSEHSNDQRALKELMLSTVQLKRILDRGFSDSVANQISSRKKPFSSHVCCDLLCRSLGRLKWADRLIWLQKTINLAPISAVGFKGEHRSRMVKAIFLVNLNLQRAMPCAEHFR